jgi:acetate kinase
MNPMPSSSAGNALQQTVLTLNAGSSSLKVALYGPQGDAPLVTGQVDRIGPQGVLHLHDTHGRALSPVNPDLRDHSAALRTVIDTLQQTAPGLQLVAVGHRVVHGGVHYTTPVVVDDNVLADLQTLEPLAPLHQPHNLTGVRMAMQAFAGVPQVACFDTAFHRDHPFVNDTFAIPYRYYEQGVRRYGFHGLSYEYITGELLRVAPSLYQGRVVVAHLGNGASMCAIHGGRSVASTMGFSALDGLPMGTRSGQIDPGVLLYMLEQEGLTAEQIRHVLYHESGLLGLSGGLSNDMRTLQASDKAEARRAIDYFVFRIQRELGAMAAAMGGIDALVFCGGIGEHSALVRQRVCEGMGWMGIEIDHDQNERGATVVSSALARTTVMVIATQEELVIAKAARRAAGLAPQEQA